MKKVLYIINEGLRKFTYERTAGLYRAIQGADEPISLYIVRSDGYSGFALDHNRGESNIFHLPNYDDFDGIFLDINSNFNAGINASGASGVEHCIRAARASGKPVVTMANYIDGFYYVGIDNYKAMTSVIRRLHRAMGLTDFWFAMGPEDNYENRMRTQALTDYCEAKGLAHGAEQLHAESYVLESGIHAFEALYARHGGRLPQAVICANDSIALGVCRAAEAAGFSVPRDLLVTGFDNLDISACLKPHVTTVDQLPWTMGDVCLDVMQRLWRGEDVPTMTYTPTQLVLRESTGEQTAESGDPAGSIEEYIHRDMRLTEFNYRFSAMEYELPGCRSIQEICRALTRCVSFLSCKGLYLVLDEKLYNNMNSAYDLGENLDGIDNLTRGLKTEGYPETMELVYAWRSGSEPAFPRERIRGMLPLLEANGGRENYLLVPLHFMEYTVGYLVVWDCVEIMQLKCVSYIVNAITMAMHSYFAKSRLSRVNRMLSGLSMKDELTGLYNRLGYSALAQKLFDRRHADGHRLGILFIDMDDMKNFNDTHGHAYGDRAIQSISGALTRSLPEGAIAVRYGGDEFLIFMAAAGQDDGDRVIDAILRTIPAEARALGLHKPPRISTGFVLTDPDTDKPLQDYVDAADRLMYAAKKRTKDRLAGL